MLREKKNHTQIQLNVKEGAKKKKKKTLRSANFHIDAEKDERGKHWEILCTTKILLRVVVENNSFPIYNAVQK